LSNLVAVHFKEEGVLFATGVSLAEGAAAKAGIQLAILVAGLEALRHPNLRINSDRPNLEPGQRS
jgi:hypothetical protein